MHSDSSPAASQRHNALSVKGGGGAYRHRPAGINGLPLTESLQCRAFVWGQASGREGAWQGGKGVRWCIRMFMEGRGRGVGRGGNSGHLHLIKMIAESNFCFAHV